MAEGNGLVTALRALRLSEGGGDAGDAGDLFGNHAAELPLAGKGQSGPKGGRPAGARNLATREWASFLLSRYQSPLVVLAEIYSRPTAELHDALQKAADKHTRKRDTANGSEEVRVLVDPAAVLKMQMQAAEALAEYVHQKQPKAIEVAQRPRGMLLLGDLALGEEQSDELAIPFKKTE